jgi:hypothetical protein
MSRLSKYRAKRTYAVSSVVIITKIATYLQISSFLTVLRNFCKLLAWQYLTLIALSR